MYSCSSLVYSLVIVAQSTAVKKHSKYSSSTIHQPLYLIKASINQMLKSFRNVAWWIIELPYYYTQNKISSSMATVANLLREFQYKYCVALEHILYKYKGHMFISNTKQVVPLFPLWLSVYTRNIHKIDSQEGNTLLRVYM